MLNIKYQFINFFFTKFDMWTLPWQALWQFPLHIITAQAVAVGCVWFSWWQFSIFQCRIASLWIILLCGYRDMDRIDIGIEMWYQYWYRYRKICNDIWSHIYIYIYTCFNTYRHISINNSKHKEFIPVLGNGLIISNFWKSYMLLNNVFVFLKGILIIPFGNIQHVFWLLLFLLALQWVSLQHLNRAAMYSVPLPATVELAGNQPWLLMYGPQKTGATQWLVFSCRNYIPFSQLSVICCHVLGFTIGSLCHVWWHVWPTCLLQVGILLGK